VSEYQYYEFQALDRPLDAEAQAALRRISTRAEITSRSLVNTYEWGNFKGNPRRLVEQWFDLFVYWTNWGTRTLMLRVPSRFVDLKAVRPYRAKNTLDVRTVNNFTIVEIGSDIEPSSDDFSGEETSISAPFTMLRNDLLRGDLSCLYLGWLLGVQDGSVKDNALEPPRPPGLANPSAPLTAFAEFFGLDLDLLAVACEPLDDTVPPIEPSPAELRAFIATLPESDKTELLCQAVLKYDPHLALTIRRRWEKVSRTPASAALSAPRRTAYQLRTSADAHVEKRMRRAAKAQTSRSARNASTRSKSTHP
jgi:hypothetical protein